MSDRQGGGGGEQGQTGMELSGEEMFYNKKEVGAAQCCEWSECYRMVHVKVTWTSSQRKTRPGSTPGLLLQEILGCDQEFAFLTGAQVACENHFGRLGDLGILESEGEIHGGDRLSEIV